MSDHFNFDFDLGHVIQPRTNRVTNLFIVPDTTSRTSAPVTTNIYMCQSAFDQSNPPNMNLYPLTMNSTGRNESRTYENGNNVEIENNNGGNGSDQSFFDCNICWDLSKEPILTFCGHLFCWSCIHKWLQVSKAKECPVCNGQVTPETVIPIYGRVGERREFQEILQDTINIPSRPHARRVDSMPSIVNRLIREGHTEEAIRSLSEREEMLETEARRFYYSSMNSRGIRSEQNQARAAIVEEGNQRSTSRPLFNGRQLEWERIENQARAAIDEPLNGINYIRFLRVDWLSSEDQNENEGSATIVEPGNGNLNVGVDDGDSDTSRMGVIMNSENEIDNAVEINSLTTVSNSEVSDLDGVGFRPMRRRRLT